MTAWTVERRRMALVHGLRPVAAAACFLAGVAVAALGGGLMARLLGRAGTLDGLAWPVVGAFVAGVAELALAVL